MGIKKLTYPEVGRMQVESKTSWCLTEGEQSTFRGTGKRRRDAQVFDVLPKGTNFRHKATQELQCPIEYSVDVGDSGQF